MYCTQCGAKLNDDARFCTKCGAPVDMGEGAPAETVDAASAAIASTPAAAVVSVSDSAPKAAGISASASAPAPAAAHATQTSQEGVTFAEAMDSARRKGRRKMPLIVLVALITLLLSATAFAAYYVYTNVIAPAIEQAQQDGQAVNEPAEEEAEPLVQAQGNPENILQVAEIMAMEPAEIAEYLDASGLQYQADIPYGPSWMGDSWAITSPLPGSETALAHQMEASSRLAVSVEAGSNAWDNGKPSFSGLFYGGDHYSKEDLMANKVPRVLTVFGIPIDPTKNFNLDWVLSAAKLPNPRAQFSYEGQYLMSEAYLGEIEIQDETMIYAVNAAKGAMPNSEYHGAASLSCFSEDWARYIALGTELFTVEEWDSANKDQRLDMVAKSLVQTSYESNGGYRMNVVTGEPEFYDNNDAYGGNKWVTKEEYLALHGNTDPFDWLEKNPSF